MSDGDCYLHDKVTKSEYNSALSKGGDFPDPNGNLEKEIKIKGVDHKYIIPTGKNSTRCGWGNHNEFVVYNTNQIKMRYLIRVKMN